MTRGSDNDSEMQDAAIRVNGVVVVKKIEGGVKPVTRSVEGFDRV